MNLFEYGTLMWPEILEAVTGLRLSGEPVVLHGYCRLRVRGEVYPVVKPLPGGSVEGILYRALNDEAFARLDAFEGDLYERRILPLAGTEAAVYLLAPGREAAVEDRVWHPEQFGPAERALFCSEYRGWESG